MITASLEPKIYKSLLPPVPVVRHSVFTFLFEQSTYYAHSPSAPAFIDYATGKVLTRGDVKTLALKLAWGLRNTIQLHDVHSTSSPSPSSSPPTTLSARTPTQARHAPLRRGDTVMFLSPNSLSWPIALFGCVAAGLKITFAASGSTPRELSWQYLDSYPRVIFAARALVPVVKEMFALVGASNHDSNMRLPEVWVMDTLSDLVIGNRTADVGAGAGDVDGVRGMHELVGEREMVRGEVFDGDEADETLYLCYSSGTTGRPKGVETSHCNVGTVLGTTHAVWSGCETEKDVYIGIVPAYNMFGLTMLMHYPFMRGKPLVIMNQGFHPKTFCEAVERYRVTSVCLVPPIILSLTNYPELDKYDLSSITNITSGAAPLSVALANKCLERLSSRGASAILIQGCGSTETTCPAQIVAPADSVRKFGSVGQLVPNVEGRIVVEVSSGASAAVEYRDAAEGEEGEMWLRGPTLCKGYLKNPAANASTFTEDGWYMSGDIMRRDEDGYYYILDRKKEMLKYKGHQIAPAELEAILMENPEVVDVGVIGLKDDYTGDELPRAYVVPSNPAILSNQKEKRGFESRVETWFRGQVSPPKYLRGGVRAMSEIPKSGTGKISRKDLREMAHRENKREQRAVLSHL